MKITWNTLNKKDANGTITGYAVCYKASETPDDIDCTLNSTVDNVSVTMTVLQNLQAATTYNVAVKARTSVGDGNLGPRKRTKTKEDGKLPIYIFSSLSS